MTTNSSLKQHLEEFITHKESLRSTSGFFELDEFGFALNWQTGAAHKIDLMVSGLTHGNEIIGLELINKIICGLKKSNSKMSVGFILNNTKAYLSDLRYIDFDLNRSFLLKSDVFHEHKRAGEIEKIILHTRPRLILDLHQTIEAALNPFIIIPESPSLINICAQISPQLPIVTFSSEIGFSAQGKTLIEFATLNSIPAVVFELGEKGFNETLSTEYSLLIQNLNIENLLKTGDNRVYSYWKIIDSIPNKQNFKLVAGFKNFQQIKINDILAINSTNNTYVSAVEGIIVFPRYENLQSNESQLGYIAVKCTTMR